VFFEMVEKLSSRIRSEEVEPGVMMRMRMMMMLTTIMVMVKMDRDW